MALVVETGSGSATAESYISVSAASTRHTAFGNAAWAAAASDAVREQALRRATSYMIQTYRTKWTGYRNTATQALDWPRSYVYLEPYVQGAVGEYPYLVADDIVPAEVANACADLALRALSEDLTPDLERAVRRKKIGPLETEYEPFSPQAKRFRAVDAMLAPYLTGSSAMATLVRA